MDVNFTLIIPELLLAVGAMALLMIGVFRGNEHMRGISWLSVLLLLGAAAVTIVGPDGTAFDGTFIVDGFARFAKVLTLVAAAVILVISLDYLEAEQMGKFEFPVLIVLATLGMIMMISANGLITLYMGLELQSLALYVIAAFKRNSERSSEAGLKYFVLGALSSGLLLYGASMVYGFTGRADFPGIAYHVAAHGMNPGLIVGMVFMASGLAFKISAVPFHMWTPDVYEGAPTPVTAFFAAAPKVAAMALFVRVVTTPFGDAVFEWQQVIVVIAIASMALGAFAAIGQNNIKRLMAYSSIGHMGFALVGLAAGTEEGVRGVLIYMALYVIMTAGVFVCILSMRRREGMVEDISELSGLSKNHPGMAFALAVLMFSLAGIPPLAGFPAKLYVFLAAVNAELYILAVIGLLSSVVGAFYYIRIVKIMYMDEPVEAFVANPKGPMAAVLAVSTLVTALFLLAPTPLIGAAGAAASSLFAGG